MNVIEQYIRDVLEGGQRKKGTILSALDTFKNFNAWREEAGKGEPETLARADLREFKAWMLARMPSNTARKHWTRVHALYRYLVDEDVIVKAPTHGIEPPALTHKAPRVWSMDDLRAMLAACRDEVDRLTFYAFALTGMRDGEVRKLSWKPAPDHETSTRAYVDFDADALVITGAKGGKSRNVPLHPLVRAELEKRWKHVSTYGFLSREWVYEDYNHSRRVMDRLMKAASSDGSRHVFRKTALTWMDRHGVRDIVAKAIVGHAAQGVTQVHYLSVDDTEKVAAIRGLYAGELDGTESPAPTVLHNGNGGLDASGLTPEQRAAVEAMITAFRGKEAVAA